ncbi:MAG: hypothetical protein ACC662_00285, partial [Planctomycetota bacterium]
VEAEEAGPGGACLPIARQVVRPSAAVVDLERLGSPPGRLRWRVRSVARGRRGPPSAWVALR